MRLVSFENIINMTDYMIWCVCVYASHSSTLKCPMSIMLKDAYHLESLIQCSFPPFCWVLLGEKHQKLPSVSGGTSGLHKSPLRPSKINFKPFSIISQENSGGLGHGIFVHVVFFFWGGIFIGRILEISTEIWWMEDDQKKIPSGELTYPQKMAFWRWFSFSQGGIC